MPYTEYLNRPLIRGSALFLLAFGFASLIIPYGALRLTYDSFDYLVGGESMLTYLEGKNADGKPYMNRGPFLYFFLSWFESPLKASWWLNTLSFAISIVLVDAIARRLQLKTEIVFVSLLAIAMSWPWLQNHFFVWTEPFFTTLTLFLTYLILTKRSIVYILLLCVLSFFLRRAGIIVSIGVIGILFLDQRKRDALLLLIFLGGVYGVWYLLELRFLQESPSVDNVKFLASLSRVHHLDVITSWLIPKSVPLEIRIILLVGTILSLLILLRRNLAGCTRWQNNRIPLIIFSVYFLVFIVVFGTPDYHEAERFLSVMIPLFMLIMAQLIQWLIRLYPSRKRVFLALFVCWTAYPVTRTVFHLFTDF